MQETGNTITVAQSGENSTSFQRPGYAVFTGFLIPDMTDGNLGLEASPDDTNFYTVLDPTDSQALVIVASGSDPGLIDVSDFIRYIPSHWYFRITCAAQAAAKTIYWFCRG